MPTKGLEVLIRKAENMLFFFNVVTFSLVLTPTTGYWRVKCIIPSAMCLSDNPNRVFYFCE